MPAEARSLTAQIKPNETKGSCVPLNMCTQRRFRSAVCSESSLGSFWIAKDEKFCHADVKADLSTDNPPYTDTRYNDKIR